MLKKKKLEILVIANLIFLIGCGNPFKPTPTLTSTSSPTPTNCPPVVLDRTPAPETIKPYLVIVLFEDAFQSQNNQDIEMLKGVFREYTEPGDYILMMKMEPLSLSSATFFQEKVGSVPPPPLPPLPTKYPTFTPIPSPSSTPDTTIAQTSQANHMTETVTAVAPTVTYQAFEHLCAMNLWQGEYHEIEQNYLEEKQDKREEFAEKITPLDGDPISRTAVWNGLEMATLVLENECKYYNRCILIIFSDMDEVNSEPGDSKIYLPLSDNNNTKLDLLVVMRNCPFLYAGPCNYWKNFWENFFTSRSTLGVFVNSNAEESIEAIMKR